MPRVLLVDDEPVLRTVVRQYLEFSGFDVVEAGNGLQALALARERAPDIVLTDLLMPESDGLSFCRSLRADGRLGAVPVLFVTARNPDEGQRREMERLGDGVVVKPFEPDDLVSAIRALLERRPAAVRSCEET